MNPSHSSQNEQAAVTRLILLSLCNGACNQTSLSPAFNPASQLSAIALLKLSPMGLQHTTKTFFVDMKRMPVSPAALAIGERVVRARRLSIVPALCIFLQNGPSLRLILMKSSASAHQARLAEAEAIGSIPALGQENQNAPRSHHSALRILRGTGLGVDQEEIGSRHACRKTA